MFPSFVVGLLIHIIVVVVAVFETLPGDGDCERASESERATWVEEGAIEMLDCEISALPIILIHAASPDWLFRGDARSS